VRMGTDLSALGAGPITGSLVLGGYKECELPIGLPTPTPDHLKEDISGYAADVR